MPDNDSTPPWRKSSRCDTSACVEVALLSGGAALVRDAKEVDGPNLRFSRAEWAAFITALRRGDIHGG